jgi:hypothetical protein
LLNRENTYLTRIGEAKAAADKVDRKDKFVTAFMAPGIFETPLLMAGRYAFSFYTDPDSLKELIDFLTGKWN